MEFGIFEKKDMVLIISHKKSQCGVYQYGVDIANSLKKSKVHDFVYAECSSQSELHEAIVRYNPKVIIYNYHPATMPWLDGCITRHYHICQLSIIHEVTQENADNATQEVFDGFLCPDPTLKENHPYVFKTARLIPPFCNYQNMPDIPTIGSFGFGFSNKGFERLIDIAQKEFDSVRIRIHMPFNDIVDINGETHAIKTAERCRRMVTNKNAELQINHSYLSKEELLEFLAGNTLNAFFYDTLNGRGISSVTDSALAVRRPIAITKSGMFRHIWNAAPSICIEDSDLKTIIRNGIAPLVPFYNDWSEANFIRRYEEIINKVLRGAGNDVSKINIQKDMPVECRDAVVVERQDIMNDRNALIQEAERLIRAKDIAKARGILDGILKLDSQNIVSHIDLSVCDILEGKNDDAIKKLNIALSIDPDNKVAKDNLQYVLGQKPCCKNEKCDSGMLPVRHVQIELVGYCCAECEFCDWVRRPKEQMILMDTALAKKCVREARELNAGEITFHITGESLLHPDILDIMPRDYPILVSTNCFLLEGNIARELASMENLHIILAVLWSEPEKKRITSIMNASSYLQLNPRNRGIFLQLICSEHAVPWTSFMYHYFSPYLNKLPQLQLYFKQPYTQEPERPTLGYIPAGIPEGPRVVVDRLPTPQSCGPDCMRLSPNPSTDILIQSDGQIKPCFKRWPHWNIGYAQTTSLRDAWTSERFAEIRSIWAKGDPDNQLACHDCIRMAVPRGEPVWWGPGGTNVPPFVLNSDQLKRSNDPNSYPKICV
jgi:tetratricopeptide (TPR) repeat protein